MLLGINQASIERAAHQNVHNVTEFDIKPGDMIFPCHLVVKVGDGKSTPEQEKGESFFFNGGGEGRVGVAIPLGTILAYESDPNQERVFGKGGDGTVGTESNPLTGDDILPIPPATGVRINFPPAPVAQQDE